MEHHLCCVIIIVFSSSLNKDLRFVPTQISWKNTVAPCVFLIGPWYPIPHASPTGEEALQEANRKGVFTGVGVGGSVDVKGRMGLGFRRTNN